MGTLPRTVALAALVASVTLAAAACAQAGGSTSDVARSICVRLETDLGRDVFEAKLATLEACAATMQPVAVAASNECFQSSGLPGSYPFLGCIQSNVKAAVAHVVDGGGTARLAAAGANVAKTACVGLHAAFGIRFAALFGDEAGCEDTLNAVAQTALQGCAGVAKPAAADFKLCVKSALQAATTTLRRASPASPSRA